MSSAFLNGTVISWGSTAASPQYNVVPECRSISGLGKTNPLVEVTSFDSSAREYIAGLADGQEITLECNYLPGNTVQNAMITATNSGLNKDMKVVVTDSVHSPTRTKTFTFSVTMLSWSLTPSYDDVNTMTFTMKISGDITVA